MLQQECTRASCPEMKAGEWMYLCVAHGNDGAMEVRLCYLRVSKRKKASLMIVAAMLRYRLHSTHRRQRNSPSQLATSVPITVRVTLAHSLFSACLSPRRINIPPPSHRHFGSLARRLGRIFAHAYFHHREVFEQAEAESSLYARFLALTCKFELVPPEFLIIPTPSTSFEDAEPPRLLGAAVDPQHSPEDDGDDRGRGVHRGLGVDVLGGIDRNPSPRKGRNRTGTMVFSEALIMAEELGKGGASPSPERDSLVDLADAAPATEAHEHETDFVHVDVDVAEHAEEEEPLTDEHELHADLQEAYDHDLDYPEGEHLATLADADVHPERDDDDDHEGPEQDVTDDAEDEDEDETADTRMEYADEAPEHDVTSLHEIPSTTIIELSPAEEVDEPEEEDTQEEDLTEAVVEPHDDDVADAREVAEQISPDEPQEEQVDEA
jgi:hypothetical protein